MHSFDDLVAEAVAADVTGWGFDWLDRATEERAPWSYVRSLEAALAASDSALDIDTGRGEVIDEAGDLLSWMVVTEARPPNALRARDRLGPRGAVVVGARTDALPFEERSFDLVTSDTARRGRHPDVESAQARAAGLVVEDLRTARLRMEFFDIGAIVWILRNCVW